METTLRKTQAVGESEETSGISVPPPPGPDSTEPRAGGPGEPAETTHNPITTLLCDLRLVTHPVWARFLHVYQCSDLVPSFEQF